MVGPDIEGTLVADKDKPVGRMRLQSVYILLRVVWPGPLVVSVLAELVLV